MQSSNESPGTRYSESLALFRVVERLNLAASLLDAESAIVLFQAPRLADVFRHDHGLEVATDDFAARHAQLRLRQNLDSLRRDRRLATDADSRHRLSSGER